MDIVGGDSVSFILRREDIISSLVKDWDSGFVQLQELLILVDISGYSQEWVLVELVFLVSVEIRD